jgi:aspartyl-tRNA synthetase
MPVLHWVFTPMKILLIYLGFDRLVAMRLGYDSIRNVIAFPKTASGRDLLVGSPTQVDQTILKEYYLMKNSTNTENETE